jgi:hypothetical protein
LIVYFERSTWELVYTGNSIEPFFWQRINQDLGVESTFSIVPFDKVVLGIGNVGVHACNGGNVERIDDKIPDSVFQISNGNAEVRRVCGIRDYQTQMAYWAFPYNIDDSVYPNRILVYNYMTMSWAFNDDSITSFGYYQDRNLGTTWANSGQTWAQANETWNAGIFESRYRNILAGNQEGFVFIVKPDNTTNSEALQITKITATQVSPLSWDIRIYADNHNLRFGDYVKIKNCVGPVVLNNNIYQVATRNNEHEFTIRYVANPYVAPQTRPLPDIQPIPPYSGTYRGGGTLTRVSEIDIWTKQYNFYAEQGRNAYISKVDFNVDTTTYGQLLVETFVGSSRDTLNDNPAPGALIGTYILETNPYVMSPYGSYEQFQDRVWHPLYFQGDGECVQLHMFMSDAQMRNPLISESEFELNAMTFYATPTASRLQ